MGMFNPYGSLRNIVSIRIRAHRYKTMPPHGYQFHHLRTHQGIWLRGSRGVNLVRSETTFNAGATTAQGFGVITQDTQPVFAARLGFLGVDFGPLAVYLSVKRTLPITT